MQHSIFIGLALGTGFGRPTHVCRPILRGNLNQCALPGALSVRWRTDGKCKILQTVYRFDTDGAA
jgi:hypothetical protein